MHHCSGRATTPRQVARDPVAERERPEPRGPAPHAPAAGRPEPAHGDGDAPAARLTHRLHRLPGSSGAASSTQGGSKGSGPGG